MPNVYLGEYSVAGIKILNKVDSAREILMGAYATAFDFINNRKVLTKQPGVYADAKSDLANGRFLILRRIAAREAPRVEPKIDKIHKITIRYLNKKITKRDAINKLRKVVKSILPPYTILAIERKVEKAENYRWF